LFIFYLQGIYGINIDRYLW